MPALHLLDDAELKVRVPEGRSGEFAVERFTVSKQESVHFNREAWRNAGRGRRPRLVQPGRYTRLVQYRENRTPEIWMSDTPAECREHRDPIERAHGHCLVNGLGLGLCVNAMLQKKGVCKVTVIESSPDVIKLVAPHYRKRFGERFECIEADAYAWQPPKGVRYQVVWHDVWPAICGDNLPHMIKLHRKYGSKADWQGSWQRAECEWLRRC
jgi:hypothetical protein